MKGNKLNGITTTQSRERMEGEIKNFILVWTTVVGCLWYCHSVGKVVPSSLRRLSILPISCLFLILPLKLTSIHLGGVTSFFIAWLASFKLILFASAAGPLHSHPPLPLSRFIPLACFPIKIQTTPHDQQSHKPRINLATKITTLALLIRVYGNKDHLHPKFIWFCYCIHIYFMLEMLLALVGAVAKAFSRVELEPQFNEPYLATSLQDFWGRRWNLMVPKILHPTVFQPVRRASAPLTGRRWAAIPAVFSTFLVSGLMHELVVYNFGRVRPTGEMLGFFVLHGLSLSAEIVVKKMLPEKFRLPGVVSGMLTLGYVISTSFWLFFPPFIAAGADLKGCTESLAFLEFLKTRRLISPAHLSCPFL
ncbi:probable long-chain-alcohol O-fatty-acyltransferase 5 [Salvia miltiorrhiza]|uniref:probable long-chain-alcohol O-fatty-acyltransferase 5 n=1 Tax=Salvia miltiorrhiza TaxID=226208 RepID=UPI0025ACCF71|nr:probable long-chain-alcohol O-fatty-acyltransferase 5 [Salvia miltiorrhiza]